MRALHVATAAAAVSVAVLLAAVGWLFFVLHDMDAFYENSLVDLDSFKSLSNNAWSSLTSIPSTGRSPAASGRSPFAHRKRNRRQLNDDVCSCVESAQLCPPGPPGEPGAPGADGLPGLKGAQGRAGRPFKLSAAARRRVREYEQQPKRCFTCPPGPAGEPGFDGRPGSPGKPGKPGHRGPPGRHGQRGNQGPSGDPGPIGKPGNSGTPGLPGKGGITGRGAPGETGLKGIAGARGKQGRPGKPGRLGKHGGRGPSGPPGAPGKKGAEGQSGPDGYPGTPGMDFGYCECPMRKEDDKNGSAATASVVPYVLPPTAYSEDSPPTAPPPIPVFAASTPVPVSHPPSFSPLSQIGAAEALEHLQLSVAPAGPPSGPAPPAHNGRQSHRSDGGARRRRKLKHRLQKAADFGKSSLQL